MTTAFAVFTAATISVVAALNYIGSRDAIIETAKTGIVKSADAAEHGIERLLGRAFLAAETIAMLPADMFNWGNRESLLGILTVSLKASPEIYGVFVGLQDGSFIQAIDLVGPDGKKRKVEAMPDDAVTAWRAIGPAAGGRGRPEQWWHFDEDNNRISPRRAGASDLSTYDPRTRPWFIDAQKKAGAVVSGAYIFSSLKKPGITVAEPLDNAPENTVGIDLSLDDLAGVTARLSPGENGVVAILNESANVLAYPDPAKILKNTDHGLGVDLIPAAELDDDRVRAAVAGGATADGMHHSFKAKGESYIGFVRPVEHQSLAGWKIVSVAAVRDFTGGLKETLHRSLIIAGSVLIVAVAGVAMMAGWITVPVLRLRKLADQVTALSFGKMEPFDSPFDEIKQLQQSMDRMRTALDTFLRFVPRDVVRQLVRENQAAVVGGSRREVTLLFTDIEGFTAMSEKMTPEQIMSQTSEYFELMSLGIQSNMGTIDKFIGDAIMAMWNAPTEDVFHVDNACRGALAALHISRDLDAQFRDKGEAPMRTRFGLHTCEVLLGNVGAPDRMQYTCLGSGVNLASRIEGLNKFYGTQLLVSDAVRRRASPEFLFRRVDIVEAKGTSVPVTIYELMGQRGEDSAFYVGDEATRLASKYEQAFDFYIHRDFDDALRVLDELSEAAPEDPVIAQLREKCRGYVTIPPGNDWSGTTRLDAK
ncbi:MAG: adenylate/guanylate cyclase domain-containing protein [Rhodospirillales bacterium]